jgi:hypothetical protein
MAMKEITKVMLEGLETYHDWYSMINGSFPTDVWQYVDPESEAVYPILVEPIFSQAKDGATLYKELSAAKQTHWGTLLSSHKHDEIKYQRYLLEETKLRSKILSSVGEARRSQLQTGKPIREWLRCIQTSTKPTAAQMKDLMKARYRNIVSSKFVDWPIVGPEKWVHQ